MKHTLFILASILAFTGLITAQTTHQFLIPKQGTVVVGNIKNDWNPSLQNVEMPSPLPGSERYHVRAIKDSLEAIYSHGAGKQLRAAAPNRPQNAAPAPVLNRNFQGNVYNYSVPNDNDIAISNAGKLISVQNSTLFKYDVSSNTSLGIQSLSAFASILANSNVNFDPKVIYDPGADKFICVFLNGYTDSTSSITVAFSLTGDPNGAWHFYSLPGNPLNNNLWSDYPMLAVSNNELFITVNLLHDNMSWQTGWVQTVIWQINKQRGYSGATLGPLLHTGIQYGGSGIRNLCPVKGGSFVAGPGMYFLSERNLAARNDTVFLVHVTDTINAPGLLVTTASCRANRPYFMPVNAKQPGPWSSSSLATNDSRILSAFIENNKIQFVSNTLDTATGHCGIYHGIISNPGVSPLLNVRVIGDTLLHLGYPSISYSGVSPADQGAIITVEHSSPTIFPGLSAVATDGNGNYSAATRIKPGLGYMTVLSGTQRWGDYSGSQRKYNQPGVVWVNGLYGTSGHLNSTWIAELGFSPAGIYTPESASGITGLNLYPNPMTDVLNVRFELHVTGYLAFEVYDLQGKLIKTLLREQVKAGTNNFSFSTEPLVPGTYLLKIGYHDNLVLTKLFVKS